MKPFELTEEIYEVILKEYKESGQELFDDMFLLALAESPFDSTLGGYQ